MYLVLEPSESFAASAATSVLYGCREDPSVAAVDVHALGDGGGRAAACRFEGVYPHLDRVHLSLQRGDVGVGAVGPSLQSGHRGVDHYPVARVRNGEDVVHVQVVLGKVFAGPFEPIRAAHVVQGVP